MKQNSGCACTLDIAIILNPLAWCLSLASTCCSYKRSKSVRDNHVKLAPFTLMHRALSFLLRRAPIGAAVIIITYMMDYLSSGVAPAPPLQPPYRRASERQRVRTNGQHRQDVRGDDCGDGRRGREGRDGSGCDDRLTVSWREAALRSTFHASFMKPWRTLFCDSKDNTFTGILSFL